MAGEAPVEAAAPELHCCAADRHGALGIASAALPDELNC